MYDAVEANKHFDHLGMISPSSSPDGPVYTDSHRALGGDSLPHCSSHMEREQAGGLGGLRRRQTPSLRLHQSKVLTVRSTEVMRLEGTAIHDPAAKGDAHSVQPRKFLLNIQLEPNSRSGESFMLDMKPSNDIATRWEERALRRLHFSTRD